MVAAGYYCQQKQKSRESCFLFAVFLSNSLLSDLWYEREMHNGCGYLTWLSGIGQHLGIIVNVEDHLDVRDVCVMSLAVSYSHG